MQLFVCIACGLLLALLVPHYSFVQTPFYEIVLYSLLAVGLYGATYGIELNGFRNHKNLIIRAVTIGVVLKSIIIGTLLFLIFQTPYAFLFGIIVAQIDPLSVAHLIDRKSKKFSDSGKTILRAWSSFDDPVTVLLALYVFLPLAVSTVVLSPGNYFFQLGLNVLFTTILYLLHKIIRKNHVISLLLLFVAFLFAITFQLMLGIALVGLFIRPRINYLDQVIKITFILAAVILGSLIELDLQQLIYGIVLGTIAFAAQACVTFLIASKLNHTDKLFLSIAQYNGITSIILALIISQWVSQTVSIIGFAVITINLLYYLTNHLLEKKLTH